MAYFGLRVKDAGDKVIFSSEWKGMAHNLLDASVATVVVQTAMVLRVGAYSFVGDLSTINSYGIQDILCAVRPHATYPTVAGITVEQNLGFGSYKFSKQLIYTAGGTGTVNFRMIAPTSGIDDPYPYYGMRCGTRLASDKMTYEHFGAGGYPPCNIVSDEEVTVSVTGDFVNAAVNTTVINANTNYFLIGTNPTDFAPADKLVTPNTASFFVVRKDFPISANYRLYAIMLQKIDATTIAVQPIMVLSGTAATKMDTTTKYNHPPPNGVSVTVRIIEIAA